MEIKRDGYLQKLVDKQHNGMIKVITGMRRAGKSYLLFKIFRDYLLSNGVADDHIIQLNLEDRHNKSLRDPDALLEYIDGHLTDKGQYYVLLDEVQMVNEFEDVLNSYLGRDNVDVYVTGSNARFLSKDIITEFRGRGDQVHIFPLSFEEFYSAYGTDDRNKALRKFVTYGGLPHILAEKTEDGKKQYLGDLFTETYLKDIKNRYGIRNDSDLEELINILSSGIGGLTNPAILANTFRSVKKSQTSTDTIKRYLDYLQDAFLIHKAIRYDIKGKRYIDTPAKYYFNDLGLRNACIGFRQIEGGHLMENLIFNELLIRGYSVDVGQVVKYSKNKQGNSVRKQLEVDFVCEGSPQRYYIQSALNVNDEAKMKQEVDSLLQIRDGFPKIMIVGDMNLSGIDANGIRILNIFDFLLDHDALKK